MRKVDQRTGTPKRGYEEYEMQQTKSQDACRSDSLHERGKVVLSIRANDQVLNHGASKLPSERDKENGSWESYREVTWWTGNREQKIEVCK